MRNWMLGLAAAAVAAGAAAPAAAQQDPAAVVRKAIDAHGGAAALDKFAAGRSKMTGTMVVNGADTPFDGEVTYQLPDKLRLAITATVGPQKQVVVQIANGGKTKSTVNGAPLPVSDAEKAELLQAVIMQEVSQLTPLVAPGGKYTLTAEPDAAVNGKPAAVVLVAAKGLGETRLFFDKQSGQLVKTARKGLAPDRTGKPVTEESVLSDPKPFAGAVMPTRVEVTHDGKKFMSGTMTEVTPLDKVDPATFAVD